MSSPARWHGCRDHDWEAADQIVFSDVDFWEQYTFEKITVNDVIRCGSAADHGRARSSNHWARLVWC